MNKATLIKKELLPNNFKLTFKNSESVRFLILHEEHKELYSQLELNQEYFYTWKKGKRNYCFINPYSIRKITKETEQSIATPQKNFFIQQLIKDLKLRELTKEEFLAKMGAMFLNDWIYYQGKRENKYKARLENKNNFN